jgi:hypothetical protein
MKNVQAIVGWAALGLAASLPVAFSCGGAQAPAGGPTAPSASAAPSASVAPTAPAASSASAAGAAPKWHAMNHQQRVDFMKAVVMPKMKTEFAAFDAKRYPSITCATCHGDGAKDGSFKMPNPKLPKAPSDMAGFNKLMEAKPEMTKFMASKIVPQMAELLGEEPFDPKTGKGFGCHDCHTSDK